MNLNSHSINRSMRSSIAIRVLSGVVACAALIVAACLGSHIGAYHRVLPKEFVRSGPHAGILEAIYYVQDKQWLADVRTTASVVKYFFEREPSAPPVRTMPLAVAGIAPSDLGIGPRVLGWPPTNRGFALCLFCFPQQPCMQGIGTDGVSCVATPQWPFCAPSSSVDPSEATARD